jgi:hypothetical protein
MKEKTEAVELNDAEDDVVVVGMVSVLLNDVRDDPEAAVDEDRKLSINVDQHFKCRSHDSTSSWVCLVVMCDVPARWLGGIYHQKSLPIYDRRKSL